MKKNPLIIFFCISLFVFLSCEQAIKYERPDFESQPVVWAFVEADSFPKIIIQQSLPIKGWLELDRNQQFLRGLQLVITVNQDANLLTPGEEKIYENQRFYYRNAKFDSIILPFYQGKEKILAGDKLELNFSFKDQEYTANSFVPRKVTIEKIEESQRIITDIFSSYALDVLEVYFRDNAGEKNAYRVVASLTGTEYWRLFDDSTGQYIRDDSATYSIVEYGEPAFDENQDGQVMFAEFPTHLFRYVPFQVNQITDSLGNWSSYHNIVIRVEAMSHEAGIYLQSIEDQWNTEDDPLSESVFLKGNIQNGLGIFTGVSVSDSVHFRLFN